MASREIINSVTDQKWLEGSAEPLQRAVRGAFAGDGGREIKNFLHGTWLGHPLHPVLTDIPVGAWTAALALDALEAVSGRKECGSAADLAIGVGLAGAVGSAITGITDWSETDGSARRVGLLHGLLNVAATTLYTTSLFMRKRKRSRQSGIAMSMLGYALASTAAYLGGHLVFGEQIGVDHTATADAGSPKKFTRVMADAELKENKPARVLANGLAILLVRRKDEIYAMTETCPHLGGPLSEGKLVGDAIQCPWHQSELALEDGHVVNGPTTYPARCFDVRVRAGQIEVRAQRE
ncbi:MAG: Rieske 2Fe-2S domain-containing protein [Acidobacteriota bacterium]|nr:Rieske 2Fe-2S domain-containing protein [Acidobacteriota bacterium]